LIRAALFAAAAAAALAGCGLFQKAETRACPDAVILADAKRITQFRPGPGRDLTDIEFEGEIARISGACAYGKRDLTVTLVADLVATRGPAARGEQATLPFFVAIADEARNVVAKQVFESAIPVPRGQRRAGVREEIEQVIPLSPDEPAPYYEIVVGFQLSPEQLEQNRRARAN
jgi:hypothetical protein